MGRQVLRAALAIGAIALLAGAAGLSPPALLVYDVPLGSAGATRLTLTAAREELRLIEAGSGRVLHRSPIGQTSAVRIKGLAGNHDDALTLDLLRGPLAVHFDGGEGGFDSLAIRGMRGLVTRYTATGVGAGRISTGSARISFANLEPVTQEGLGGTLTVDAQPAVTTLQASDASPAPDGRNQITGDAGFETVTFSGYNNLVLRGGDGVETISLEGLDPADPDGLLPGQPLTSVTLDGDNAAGTDSAADVLRLRTLPASISATLLGGAKRDIFHVADGHPLADVQGPVTVDGEANDPLHGDIFMECGPPFLFAVPLGDRLVVHDNDIVGRHNYTMTANTIRLSGSPATTFAGIEGAEFDVTAPDATLSVTGTNGGTAFVRLSSGTNQVTVQTVTGASFDVVGGDGTDVVDINDSGVGGFVSAYGAGGNDTLTVWQGQNDGILLEGGPGRDQLSLHVSYFSTPVEMRGNQSGVSPDLGDTFYIGPGADGPVCADRPTAAEVRSFTAQAGRTGGRATVVLHWRTASELRLLGFNVYREQYGKLTKLNRKLIASAFGGTAGGHTYSWLDRRAARAAGTLGYRLQAVDLDGTRSWVGSVKVAAR